MPQFIEEEDPQDKLAAERRHSAKQRQRLKACLPDVAVEVTKALDDAGLSFQVFLTVPSNGPLMTFATPLDPTDAEWARVRDIVNPIVSRAAGVDHLICEEAPCAAAIPMVAADLLEDVDASKADY